MKSTVTAFLTIALLASTVLAQNTSTTKMPTDEISSRGVRIGIVKPMLEYEAKVDYSGNSFSFKDKLDEAIGFSVGYASLPVQEFGWISNLTYIDIKNQGTKSGLIRLDGNLAYAFTSFVNVKGGLNLSKFTSDGNMAKLDPSLGFQGGLGFQVTKNFGVDIGYTQMNQSGTNSDLKLNFKVAGAEIGLNGTF